MSRQEKRFEAMAGFPLIRYNVAKRDWCRDIKNDQLKAAKT